MERRAIESREARHARLKHNRRRSLWILLFLAACIGIVVILFTAPIFKIQDVYCVGNARLSQEELLQVANIKPEQNIFAVNLASVRRRLLNIPYISEVETQREFPNRVKIVIRENQAAAYFYMEDNRMAVADLDGKILEIIDDADQIQALTQDLSVSKDEEADIANNPPTVSPAPTGEPVDEEAEEVAETAAPDAEATPDTEATSDAEATPDAEVTPVPMHIAYRLPVVFGIEVKDASVGDKVTDKNTDKIEPVMAILKQLDSVALLERTSKIDVSDMSDVKLWFENRLELWIGSLDNFEYKSRFVATVIKDNLSAYETAVMDFRNDKLYVRAPGSITPKTTPAPETEEGTPSPSAEPDESPSPTEQNENHGSLRLL